MNYRAIVSSLGLCMLASFAMADRQTSSARLSAIWDAVDNRVTSQTDAWYEDGDFPKVIHLLEWQAADQPHNYDVVTNLGWMQENIEEWDVALATYERYRKQNPQDRDAALPEVQFLFMRKQFGRIPALAEPALSGNPHPNLWRMLAHSYEKLHKYDDAKRIWLKYLASHPGDDQAKRNLTSLEKKMGATKTR